MRAFWKWLCFEIRWAARRDWVLVKVEPLHPMIDSKYWLETWRDKRTGQERQVLA